MTSRILIDARAGILELEGDKAFIEAQLEKLLPLIESAGFGTNPVGESLRSDPANTRAHDTPADETNTSKRTKRGGSRPPKGHSCAARMMTLREDGFFKQHRTPAAVVEGLAAKGWTHNGNQVAAAGLNMFNRGDIQRTKRGRGFQYFWDRG